MEQNTLNFSKEAGLNITCALPISSQSTLGVAAVPIGLGAQEIQNTACLSSHRKHCVQMLSGTPARCQHPSRLRGSQQGYASRPRTASPGHRGAQPLTRLGTRAREHAQVDRGRVGFIPAVLCGSEQLACPPRRSGGCQLGRFSSPPSPGPPTAVLPYLLSCSGSHW